MFQFEVGQCVLFKVAIEQARLSCAKGVAQEPVIGMVIERSTQECPGGVQRHYIVSDGGSRHIKANEIELTTVDAFDFAGEFEKAEAIRERREAERRKRQWETINQ